MATLLETKSLAQLMAVSGELSPAHSWIFTGRPLMPPSFSLMYFSAAWAP
jgi:hypothetical protein